jgi:N-succinyldiaminopimelate aminotransferase
VSDVARPPLVERLRGLGVTIFAEMTELATRFDAINLGQGFPDHDPPAALLDAARRAMDAGHHQYPPAAGVPALREAVAAHQRRRYGLDLDADREVTVTFGATEAIAATVLATCERGDELVVIEPAYDAYAAVATIAGARVRRVPLERPDFAAGTGWWLDPSRLEATIGPRTRAIVVNSPHNPTGVVLDGEALDEIARLCVTHDLIAITDEVYEHLVFDGVHEPLVTRPGMGERTVTVSSAGKTFSCTGWKVGWACAPVALTAALRTTKQYLSYAGGAPLQHAVAHVLEHAEVFGADERDRLRARRDLLCDGLEAIGMPVARPAGTYFVTADLAPLGHEDAAAFCRWAPEAIGLAAVPVSAFVGEPALVASLVRLAVCKREEVLVEGVQRLALAASMGSRSD